MPISHDFDGFGMHVARGLRAGAMHFDKIAAAARRMPSSIKDQDFGLFANGRRRPLRGPRRRR